MSYLAPRVLDRHFTIAIMNLKSERQILDSTVMSRDVMQVAPQDDYKSRSTMPTRPSKEKTLHQRPDNPLSDSEMLQRARDAHQRVDFTALTAGPHANGPWKRLEAADRFVIFRGLEGSRSKTTPRILCAGRLDATIEEVARVLNPHSEAEHHAVMKALHGKRFLFGSFERSVSCIDSLDNQQEPTLADKKEHLTHSLGRNESTPARITGAHGRVEQLHGVTASYSVDLDPGNAGLRIVFNANFVPQKTVDSSASCIDDPASSPESSTDLSKAHARRFLLLARGVTRIPDLVRHRRFGFQIPADQDIIQVSNSHCVCCTRSLSPFKLSLSAAASAISHRSLTALKPNTRRCYLCGYLVCKDCWNAEKMECMLGRVATIVACRRCQTNVAACDYSAIAANPHCGPARVIEDSPTSTKASLLVDLLADSLTQTPVGSKERSKVLNVIRTLLHQDEDCAESDSDYDDEYDAICVAQTSDAEAVASVDRFLRDEHNFPLLEACKLGNTERRSYVLDLPDHPETSTPKGPIPANEACRLSSAQASGLLHLADHIAPREPAKTNCGLQVNVQDLKLICHLAAQTLGCSNAMISVMGSSHEHILASTDAAYAGMAVPRDHTMCQHQLMSQDPLVLVHPEADVRFQAVQTIKLMSLRSYIGFPLTTSMLGTKGDQIAVGTLCCIDSKPHHELRRSQYATMQHLARTASTLVQRKAQDLQRHL